MDFASLLPPAAVALEAAVTTRRGALERLAPLLAEGAGAPPAAVLAALLAREEVGITGFGDGTAIPHGRLPGLTRTTAAVLRLAQPVDWGSVDGISVDLVVGLIGPDEAGAEPLKALALVSRSLRDRALVAKLRGAGDAAALRALLAGQARAAA
jgi:PTS system nitrogen regulatory IIA component